MISELPNFSEANPHTFRTPEYNAQVSEIHASFIAQTENYFNMERWPTAARQKAHELAWQAGHSGGYSEIFNSYYDLVDLGEAFLDAPEEE
jgi:hypothetical protein